MASSASLVWPSYPIFLHTMVMQKLPTKKKNNTFALLTSALTKKLQLSIENVEKLRSILKNYNPIHRMNRKANLSFLEHPRSLDGLLS